jgi:hypothetical protein
VTWPRALIYVGIWAVLTLYYFVFERARPPVVDAVNGTAQEHVRLLSSPAAITELELETPEHVLRCRRAGETWEVVEPPNVQAPSDLIAAVVGALADLHSVPVVRSDATPQAEEQFGLHRPRARITLGGSGFRLTIQLGQRNPAQTAVYARREGQPEILLLGLNVQYYVDLLLEALRRQNA